MKIAKKGGFTLVELVVVIAIIAILMALAIVTINTVRRQSRNAQLRNDAQTTKIALESYYASNKNYPEVTGHVDGYANLLAAAKPLNSYVTSVPTNPTSGTNLGKLCYAHAAADSDNVYTLYVIPEGNSAACASSYTVPSGDDFSIEE